MACAVQTAPLFVGFIGKVKCTAFNWKGVHMGCIWGLHMGSDSTLNDLFLVGLPVFRRNQIGVPFALPPLLALPALSVVEGSVVEGSVVEGSKAEGSEVEGCQSRFQRNYG